MNTKWQITKYLIADFMSASIAWSAFFIFRKVYIEPQKFH